MRSDGLWYSVAACADDAVCCLSRVFEAKQRARTGAQTKSSASEKPTPPPKQPVQVQAAAAAVTPQSDHIGKLLTDLAISISC